MSRLFPVPAESARPLPYSGFWRRTVATAIDLLLLFLLMGAVGVAAVLSVGGLTGSMGLSFVAAFLMAVIAVPWLYYAGLDSSGLCGTIGKWLMGLEVTDLEQAPLTLEQASVRHLARCCSVLLLGTGYLFCLWTRRRQTFHDWLSDTLVLYPDEAQEGSLLLDPN
ncbi:MAG: RDD family protein [Mycobacterium leprae]